MKQRRFEIKDYSDEKSIKKNFHKQRRCDVSGGYIYGDVIIMREGKGRGSGIAINKESLLNAIQNSPKHFKTSLIAALIETDKELLIASLTEPAEAVTLSYTGEPAEAVTLPHTGEPTEAVTLPHTGEPAEVVPVENTEKSNKFTQDEFNGFMNSKTITNADLLAVLTDAGINPAERRPNKTQLLTYIQENNLTQVAVGLLANE